MMKKGEFLISVALAALVITLFIMAQQHWQGPTTFKAVARHAEAYLLNHAKPAGGIPQISGYNLARIYNLNGDLRAVLYRSRVVTLGIASGRLLIYNRAEQPLYRVDTLEGARDNWTAIYDFAGRHGMPVAGGRPTPLFLRDINGDGKTEMIIGQYSGGDRCCTTLTVLRVDLRSLNPIARIHGLDGWPFDGLDVRRLARGRAWQLIVHRPVTTSCGSRSDAAEVISIYAYRNGAYADQTDKFGNYLEGVLREDLARWAREKSPPISLLQSIAALYAQLGQPNRAKKFFAQNLPRFIPELEQQGLDPNACLGDVDNLIENLAQPPA
jgi:hypothetical protein